MTIRHWIIACDHAAAEMKQAVVVHLQARGDTVLDVTGANTPDDDYPDFADAAIAAMAKNPNYYGILLCGSGIGICIRANRYPHIRAALVHTAEEARMARLHNDANILCLGGRSISHEAALASVDAFAEAAFEGGRHQRRVGKIDAPLKVKKP